MIKWITMKFLSIILLALTLILFSPLNEPVLTQTASAENTKIFSIKISKRRVVGEKKLLVSQGDQITLLWQTDENVELHLHGYNIKKKIITNKTTPMQINARATGRFPVTSHGFSGEQAHTHGRNALFYIEVYPK
jgi:hypothetical protein